MLNNREKREMVNDALDGDRKKAFRASAIKDTQPEYDAYLKFLQGLHKLFIQTEERLTKTPKTRFKL